MLGTNGGRIHGDYEVTERMRELTAIENEKMNYNNYIYGLLALLLLTIPNFSPAAGPTEESDVISANKT